MSGHVVILSNCEDMCDRAKLGFRTGFQSIKSSKQYVLYFCHRTAEGDEQAAMSITGATKLLYLLTVIEREVLTVFCPNERATATFVSYF